jgi:Putative peptidoglycan binding domain
MLHCFPRLGAAALLFLCTTLPFAVTIEAKGKKRKASISRSRGKSARHARTRNAHPPPGAMERDHAVVPDEIEVMEHGTPQAGDLAHLLRPSGPSAALSGAYVEPDLDAPVRQRKISIEPARVIQIQQALARHGHYRGEMNGLYDDATVDGMRRFQAANKIAATGYPTAASLKRLGLTTW